MKKQSSKLATFGLPYILVPSQQSFSQSYPLRSDPTTIIPPRHKSSMSDAQRTEIAIQTGQMSRSNRDPGMIGGNRYTLTFHCKHEIT